MGRTGKVGYSRSLFELTFKIKDLQKISKIFHWIWILFSILSAYLLMNKFRKYWKYWKDWKEKNKKKKRKKKRDKLTVILSSSNELVSMLFTVGGLKKYKYYLYYMY